MFRKRLDWFFSVLVIVGIAAAACAGPAAVAPATPTPGAEPTAEAAEGPRDGGTLNYAFSQQIFDFNPLTAVQGVQGDMMRLIFNRLLDYDVGLTQLIPGLAESYEVSEDGKTVTFHLRKDATWHDGEPFTAEDVAFTFTIALNSQTGSLWAGRLRSIEGAAAYSEGEANAVSGIRVLDDYTVQFTLSQPDAVFIVMAGILSILPAHILGDVPPDRLREQPFFVKQPIGTGPFKLIEYVENQYVLFERNENYFRGRPHIEKINWLIVDAATVPAGLEKGEIDVTRHVPNPDLERFIDNPDYKIYWQPSNVFCNFSVNVERVPKKIRHAIAYAIDRETLVQEFHLGGRVSQVWNEHFGHDWLLPHPGLNDYPYNPETAKALVQEAIAEGAWSADRQLDLTFTGGQPSDELVFMAQNIEQAGIKVAMRSVGTGAASQEEIMIKRNYDIAWGCNEWGPDPTWVEIYYRCDFTLDKGGYNNSNFCDPEVDELFDKARYTLDTEERKQYYHRIMEIRNDELPKIVIRRVISPWVMTKRVMEATPQYFGSMPNYNAVERWWLAE